jgi:hypothetical protein
LEGSFKNEVEQIFDALKVTRRQLIREGRMRVIL